MALRQQRRSTARGSVPFKPLAVASSVSWKFDNGVGAVVNFTLEGITGVLSLSGIPQMHETEHNIFPIGATLTGNVLSLTYGETLTSPRTFVLGDKDPALRTSLGGYLASGTQRYNAEAEATVVFVGGGGVSTNNVMIWAEPVGGGTMVLDDGSPTLNYCKVAVTGLTAATINVEWPAGTLLQNVNPGSIVTFSWNGSAWVF